MKCLIFLCFTSLFCNGFLENAPNTNLQIQGSDHSETESLTDNKVVQQNEPENLPKEVLNILQAKLSGLSKEMNDVIKEMELKLYDLSLLSGAISKNQFKTDILRLVTEKFQYKFGDMLNKTVTKSSTEAVKLLENFVHGISSGVVREQNMVNNQFSALETQITNAVDQRDKNYFNLVTLINNLQTKMETRVVNNKDSSEKLASDLIAMVNDFNRNTVSNIADQLADLFSTFLKILNNNQDIKNSLNSNIPSTIWQSYASTRDVFFKNITSIEDNYFDVLKSDESIEKLMDSIENRAPMFYGDYELKHAIKKAIIETIKDVTGSTLLKETTYYFYISTIDALTKNFETVYNSTRTESENFGRLNTVDMNEFIKKLSQLSIDYQQSFSNDSWKPVFDDIKNKIAVQKNTNVFEQTIIKGLLSNTMTTFANEKTADMNSIISQLFENAMNYLKNSRLLYTRATNSVIESVNIISSLINENISPLHEEMRSGYAQLLLDLGINKLTSRLSTVADNLLSAINS